MPQAEAKEPGVPELRGIQSLLKNPLESGMKGAHGPAMRPGVGVRVGLWETPV